MMFSPSSATAGWLMAQPRGKRLFLRFVPRHEIEVAFHAELQDIPGSAGKATTANTFSVNRSIGNSSFIECDGKDGIKDDTYVNNAGEVY